MAKTVDKTILLRDIRAGYASFEQLLATLNEEQMTTPGVNSAWSVKDNLAHLIEWQKYMLDRLKARNAHIEATNHYPNMNEDEINELFYQRNKSRPLADVLAELQVLYEQILEAVEQTSEDVLNEPLTKTSEHLVWALVAGDTYEHYEEHGRIIRDWLTSGQQQA
ncbi:MAG: ClbS/DfsB family four-helix bundle protein [Ktedonobacteraceae bacterium]|nr:ClbS/DfsB family four-helix bundle protein [Ktedonobacteraceae bacterium]